MASFPTEPNIGSAKESTAGSTTPSATAHILQELTACWDQGYDALTRGDLERVAGLLAIVDQHLDGLQPPEADDDDERKLRQAAVAARGRLEHGIHAGLDGVRSELHGARKGRRALAGYRTPAGGVGDRVQRDA